MIFRNRFGSSTASGAPPRSSAPTAWKRLSAPAQIYYKYEDVSPVGSHKPNSAWPRPGTTSRRVSNASPPRTRAGQWGSSIASCPTLTRGHYAYDFGDSAGLTPLTKMSTLGHDFMPPGIQAGGVRYQGDSPLVSELHAEGAGGAVAVPQPAAFEAGGAFARAEGIIPAPESNRAIRAAIDEALHCKETGEGKTMFFSLSGHGHFDMAAYDKYIAELVTFSGELDDYEYPEAAIKEALHNLLKVG